MGNATNRASCLTCYGTGEVVSESGPQLPISSWKLDVRVHALNQIFVAGMGLDSEWRADLRVTGELDILTAGKLGDLSGIDVDADNIVAKFRHPGRVGSTQVARAEDGASHIAYVGAREELPASPC